jgi:enamine deaminase RidA (YjgF/YER057c/UK114 family)
MFLVNFIYILGVGTLATWQEIAQTIEVEEIGMLMSSVTSATSMVTSLVNAIPTREFQYKKKFQVFTTKA